MIEPRPYSNPFPGIRPFNEEAATYFFGRDDDAKELLRRLQKNRIVLLTGEPSSGRASLVRAGLGPALQTMGWNISLIRPGFHPVQNLAEALCADTPNADLVTVERELHASSFGLMSPLFRDDCPRIFVVDQLEEIFHLATRAPGSNDEITHFLNLLSTAAGREKPPTYVLFIIRSDFLGECTRWLSLTDKINDGALYLLPALRRDQLRDIITGPLSLVGVQITPSLVQQILNDAANTTDALPLLQYTLFRLWEYWSYEQSDVPIDFRHYYQIGGMAESIDHGAEEVFEALDQNERRVAEHVFRSLISAPEGQPPRRRPATVAEVAAITGDSVDGVVKIIEHFAANSRGFLSTSSALTRQDTIVDMPLVLMDRWRRFRAWIKDERDSARTLMSLQSLMEYDAHPESPDIQPVIERFQRETPTQAWAAKYGLTLAPVEYVLMSQGRAKKQKRLFFALGVAAGILALLFFLLHRF